MPPFPLPLGHDPGQNIESYSLTMAKTSLLAMANRLNHCQKAVLGQPDAKNALLNSPTLGSFLSIPIFLEGNSLNPQLSHFQNVPGHKPLLCHDSIWQILLIDLILQPSTHDHWQDVPSPWPSCLSPYCISCHYPRKGNLARSSFEVIWLPLTRKMDDHSK